MSVDGLDERPEEVHQEGSAEEAVQEGELLVPVDVLESHGNAFLTSDTVIRACVFFAYMVRASCVTVVEEHQGLQ